MAYNQQKPRNRRKPKKVCIFCVAKEHFLDYKDMGKLRRLVSERGKILPRRNTGSCAKHQRMVAEAIKRARYIGLLPYCVDK
ncbi:30S ribosomal protein S18 [bacterium]|nr:30S ribosomal protein S18 [bacterium]MBT3581724.1 30S ribosomal protein S18 [bacterium]MBT4551652.1 30S ribosomal protein S18 [bacterium]MBT5989179.1 30S ribosomal protein S18 [bacterium]MBT7088548.1 30S ribosomal protein S18 [bacterium]